MIVEFTLRGERFMGLNGGPHFTHTPAVSFMIAVETQEEIDHYYSKLSALPDMEQCGWVTDRF